jgi:hypothetical protein
MADAGKATVPEVKKFFAEPDGDRDNGLALTARDLIALKKAEGVTHATAYDDLAYGIGDGSLNY